MYNKFSFYSIVVQTVAPEGSSATEGLKDTYSFLPPKGIFFIDVSNCTCCILMTKEISTGHLAVVPCGDLFRHIYDLRKFSSCWGHRTLVVTGPAILGTARSAHFAPHAPRPRAGGHRGHCGRGGSGHLLVLPLAAVS